MSAPQDQPAEPAPPRKSAHPRKLAFAPGTMPVCPQGPSWRVDWAALYASYPWLRALEGVVQDPIYHAEGDVWTHTKMVVDVLVADPAWRALRPRERQILFWAALLHDAAKPMCTKMDGKRVRSPGHAKRGATLAREILWYAGVTPEDREAVAALVRYHQKPYLFLSTPDPRHTVIQISQTARCDWLAILARADILGRICPDQDELVSTITLFASYCREQGCLRKPWAFANDHSRFLYFRKEDRDPEYKAYDDTRCELTMMCGLPGAGKDYWLRHNCPGLPVVSLDALRKKHKLPSHGNQGPLFQIAREQVRTYLRAGEDFAWNATCLTKQLRTKTIGLAAAYNARVRIVYLDRPPAVIFAQNRSRDKVVPERVIQKMAARFEVPDPSEAHQLRWITAPPH